MNPFSSGVVQEIKGLFFEGVIFCMLVGLAVSSLKQRDLRRCQANNLSGKTWFRAQFLIKRPFFIPALIYLAIWGMATIFAIDPPQSFWGAASRQGYLLTACLVVFFLLVADTVTTSNQAEGLINGILAGSVAVALYGIFQYFDLDPMKWNTDSLSPVHSTTGYSLYLGAYLAMVVPFTLARLLASTARDSTDDAMWLTSRVKLRRSFPFIIILTLQVACLVFTYSRGALVAGITGCSIFLALISSRRQRPVLVGSLLALILVGGLIFLSLNYGWDIVPLSKNAPILRANISITRQVSDADRLTVWMRTIHMIGQSIWIGYGADSYAATFDRYYPTTADFPASKSTNWDAHNLILSQLMSAGILGLLAFGTILFTFYRGVTALRCNALENEKRLTAAALLACVTAYLVQAQFNPSGIVATVLFWLTLGIGAGVARGSNPLPVYPT